MLLIFTTPCFSILAWFKTMCPRQWILFCSWPWISNLVCDFFCSFGLDWRWLNVILCFYQSYFYVICMICNLFFWVLLSLFTQCVELTPFYACHHIPTLWQDQMMRAMREQWVPFYHHFFVWLLALRLFFFRSVFCWLVETTALVLSFGWARYFGWVHLFCLYQILIYLRLQKHMIFIWTWRYGVPTVIVSSCIKPYLEDVFLDLLLLL